MYSTRGGFWSGFVGKSRGDREEQEAASVELMEGGRQREATGSRGMGRVRRQGQRESERRRFKCAAPRLFSFGRWRRMLRHAPRCTDPALPDPGQRKHHRLLNVGVAVRTICSPSRRLVLDLPTPAARTFTQAYIHVTHVHTQRHVKYSASRNQGHYVRPANRFKIAKQYTRLLALWPKDALRPNLPFTRAIEHRGQPFGVQPITPPPEDAQKKQSPAATAPAAPSTPPNPKLEQAQINALFSLLENRYSTKYALSPGVLKPTSAPEHYTKLMEEIERAPHKTWWQSKVDQWKSKIRWS